MKLNSQMPNAPSRRDSKANLGGWLASILLLGATSLLVQHSNCQQTDGRQLAQPSPEPISSNEIGHFPANVHTNQQLPKAANFSQFSRDVTNLRLGPDFRSIKLRWTYNYSEMNRPASFRIRYCELTSWRTEIKCRSREMRVDYGQQLNGTTLTTSEQQQLPVILQQQPFAFETQIFDLRALTNYTFGVQVWRFLAEPAPLTGQLPPTTTAGPSSPPGRRSASSLARRLDLDDGLAGNNQLLLAANSNSNSSSSLLVEQTKPFGAEATKCLPKSSEVHVHTGRFFGGRISVEGQTDGRCSLLGNKSSDQSSYLFRIDHDICHSKVIDGHRIETMILVHENKDILTHNTARFLVLCDFNHKSFTVRASVSLPKVQAKLRPPAASNQQQAAVITRVRPPSTSTASVADQHQQVRIGSMPGVYRPLTSATMADNYIGQAAETSNQSSPAANKNNPNELHNQQSADQRQEPALNSIQSQQQQPVHQINSSRHAKRLSSEADLADLHRQQVSPLPTTTTTSRLPGPVDVSGSLMFVDDGPATALSLAGDNLTGKNRNAKSLLLVKSKPGQKVLIPSNGQPTSGDDSRPMDDQMDTGNDQSDGPIVMTNNHRVSGDFLALEGQLAERLLPIKYSAASVADYAIGRLAEPHLNSTGQQMRGGRARSGRMHSLGASSDTEASPRRRLESRMGDVSAPAADLSASESEQVASMAVNLTAVGEKQPHLQEHDGDSLAQNLTSALLRWSLRTLGQLAKKSLESLADPDRLPNPSTTQHVTTDEGETEQLVGPPTTTTRTTSSSTARTTASSSYKKSVGRQLARPPANAIESTTTTTMPKTTTTNGQQQQQLDGFLVDMTSSTGAPNTGKARAIIEQPAGVRARNMRPEGGRAGHSPAKLSGPQQAPSMSHETPVDQQQQQQQQPDERHSSAWLIYALWAVICLVCISGAGVYLILARPSRLPGPLSKCLHQHQHQQGLPGNHQHPPSTMFSVNNINNNNNTSNDIRRHYNQAYHDVSSLSSSSTSTLRKSLISPKQACLPGLLLSQQHSPTTSQPTLLPEPATRSGSAASTSTYSGPSSGGGGGGEENYRKLNEFVFTDHVFVNNYTRDLNRNESFA